MKRDPSLIPLSHQHHNGLALCVLTDRSLARDASPENISALAGRISDRFDLEIANHFELEETILFPPLSAIPLVATLIQEHRRLEELVGTIRSEPSKDLLLEFTALLRRHIRTEEDTLFEEAQRILPREVLDEMGREFERRAVRVNLQ